MKSFINALKLRLLDPVSRRVKAEKLTYLSHSKLRSLARVIADVEQSGIPGDVYDLGIALGGSSIILASKLRTRRFHGYDVFGMIPPPGDQDGRDTHERYNVIAAGEAKGIDGGEDYYGYDTALYDRVVASFESFGLKVDGKNIALHKGLFEDTLKFDADDRAALVHVDCDWYDPVKFCLETAAPYMAVGSYFVVDDYNDYEGCKKATDQFVAAHPEFELLRVRPHAVLRRKEI